MAYHVSAGVKPRGSPRGSGEISVVDLGGWTMQMGNEDEKGSAAMKKPYRRRLLVDKFNRFTPKNLNYLLFIFLVFGFALFVPLALQMEFDVYSEFEREVAGNQFYWLHKLIWPPLLVSMLLLFLGSLLFTHRIAGPLYRLRCVMKKIGEGDLCGPITIRKRDYLQQEVNSMNEMVGSLAVKVNGAREAHKEAQEALAALATAVDPNDAKEFSQHVQRLEAHMQRLKACLDEFKTTS